eukprot:TRINITY_DN1235_c0_g1_i1.p1 TRINITY_DN1235_c0_g1~~TRINITY_DN1235_c0_g1_i1.p1  ORF type:complete len:190 (-),score=35.84 TRINITY_DN1235_c0_g1_i1:2-571(-)
MNLDITRMVKVLRCQRDNFMSKPKKLEKILTHYQKKWVPAYIFHKNPELRKRHRKRSATRSKKKSQARIDADIAKFKAKKEKQEQGAKAVTPEQKQAMQKKRRPRKEKKSKDPQQRIFWKQQTKHKRAKLKRKIKKDRLARYRAKKKAIREYKEKAKALREAGDKTSKRKKKKYRLRGRSSETAKAHRG